MRFRRKGLTPLQVIMAYALALALVLGHEANRLADWLADLGRADAGPAQTLALNLAADLRATAQNWGLDRLETVETSFLRDLTPDREVGGQRAPSTEPYPLRPETDTTLGSAEDSQSAKTELPLTIPLAIPLTIPLVPDKPTFQKILLTGDSMMLEGLGPPLQKLLAGIDGVEVSREGKYATGLCRLDVFDWLAYFQQLLTTKKPDLAIITIGANDTQDIVDGQGRRFLVTTPGWRELYGQRVSGLLTIAQDNNVTVFWIGLPIMGREPYNARVAVINEVAKLACQDKANCRFFDTWEILADKGRYSTFLNLEKHNKRVRAKDLIHLTETGGKIMAEAFLTTAQDWATLGPAPQPAGLAVVAPEVRRVEAREVETRENEVREILDDLTQIPTQLAPAAQAIFPPPTMTSEAPSQVASPANQPPPPPAQTKTSSFAALAVISLKSKLLGRTTSYQVYAPKASGPFPAVFLLSGAGEDYQVFGQRLGPQLWALAEQRGLALIALDSGDYGWYLDSPINPRSQYKSYFFQELMPDVLARFPLQGDRLALLGVSMGGHGALAFALAQPGRFRAVGAMSAVTDLSVHSDATRSYATHSDVRPSDLFSRLDSVLGSYDQKAQQWRSASAYWQTRQNPEALAGVDIFLTVGRSDPLVLAENRQYHRLLTDGALPHEYREDSGGHDWELWTRQWPDHLAFLARSLGE
ncbi:MAG: DUF459 domain-containing protein [Deltaproteobacteria bacterium]|jgi:S-formylglutathione hydrolase FrmB|nr:DUF459 domain-containing protein [Deltaproteobacteria bacterium]